MTTIFRNPRRVLVIALVLTYLALCGRNAYAGVQTTCFYTRKGFTYTYPRDQTCPAKWTGKIDGKAVSYAFVRRVVTRF